MSLPALPTHEVVHERLPMIFPAGTPERNYLTRELAASTVFVGLYIGAIEGSGVWLAPKHVYRMSDIQAALTDPVARASYNVQVMKPGGRAPGEQWYADNSRESIRDETLREGLVVLGAAIERPGIPTTSGKPRYAFQAAFAALFAPNLTGTALSDAIAAWQAKCLTPGALARIAIVRGGAATGGENVLVAFPSGETRRLQSGPSSIITKAVIEVFAPQFLGQPAVIFVSESSNKVVSRDDDLARSIGLDIKADKNLPDIILVDLAPEHPLLVFIEAVATDGPINERRKEALADLARAAGFPVENIAYVTAYLDRSGSPFKKTIAALAWGSYAWFVSEPAGLIQLSTGKTTL